MADNRYCRFEYEFRFVTTIFYFFCVKPFAINMVEKVII